MDLVQDILILQERAPEQIVVIRVRVKLGWLINNGLLVAVWDGVRDGLFSFEVTGGDLGGHNLLVKNIEAFWVLLEPLKDIFLVLLAQLLHLIELFADARRVGLIVTSLIGREWDFSVIFLRQSYIGIDTHGTILDFFFISDPSNQIFEVVVVFCLCKIRHHLVIL